MTMGVLDDATFPHRFGPTSLELSEPRAERMIGPRELLALLRRRMRLIAGCGIVGLALSLLAVHELPRSFRAQAMILLQPDDPNLLDETTDQPIQQPNKSMMDTEADLMTSRMFIGLVVDELNLIAEPEFNTYLPQSPLNEAQLGSGRTKSRLSAMADHLPEPFSALARFMEDDGVAPLPSSRVQRDRAISVLLSRLTLTRSGESSVMDVSVVDGDPHRAAQLANAITRLFVVWTRDEKRQEMKQAADFLRQQGSELAARIAKIEQEIAEYGKRNQVSNDPRDDLLRLAMQQANEQLSAARADLTQARARLAQAKHAPAAASSSIDALLSSDFLTVLRGEEALALKDRAELARNRGANHPLIQQADAKISSIQTQISQEFDRLVAGLEGNVRIAEGRVDELERDLAAAEAELRQRSLAEIRLRELNRDLLTEQKLHDVVAARLGKLDPFAQVAEPGARVVSIAAIPTVPYFPKPYMLVGGGLIGALVLGFVTAVTLESLDTCVRDSRRAAKLVRAPLLASIPRLRRRIGKSKPDIIHHLAKRPRSSVEGAFRTLYRACRRGSPKSGKQVILVTSVSRGDGGAAVAAGLAATAAMSGLRTVLLDCQPRARSRPASLPEASSTGLLPQSVRESRDVQALLQPVLRIRNLFVLAPARDDVDLTDTLGGDGFEKLLVALRDEHDIVVVSAPPVLVVEDGIWAAAHADAVVLVAAWDRTTEESLVQAGECLRMGGASLTGLVLNQVGPGILIDGSPRRVTTTAGVQKRVATPLVRR